MVLNIVYNSDKKTYNKSGIKIIQKKFQISKSINSLKKPKYFVN